VPPGRRHWIAFAAVAAAALAADQATKAIVRATLDLGEAVPAVGPFSIHHVRNSGILGGHLQGSAVPIAVASALALAGLVVYVLRRRNPGALSVIGFGLLLGGGLGNLVDRLRLGYVTDFVDRGQGGAFNAADLAVTLGLVVLLVAHVLRRRTAETRLDPRPETPRGD
jgi:signal peptidase II